MTDNDLQKACQAAKRALLQSGQELKHYYGNVEALDKGGDSVGGIVTELDRKTETFLEQALGSVLPNAGFRGEEFGVKSASETTWLVDPIDGTAHFVRGIPFCTTMIALIHRGEVVVSAIHDFVHGDIYWAIRGQGAFKNDQKIFVSKRTLQQSIISFETRLDKPKNYEKYVALRKEAGLISTLNAGFEFAMIASGKLDARIGLDPYGMDWDFAPGSLLVEEAGGVAKNIGKDTYDYRDHDYIIGNPLVYEGLTTGENAIFGYI